MNEYEAILPRWKTWRTCGARLRGQCAHCGGDGERRQPGGDVGARTQPGGAGAGLTGGGYATAEKQCTFWPTPGQIRELAGWSDETRAGGGAGLGVPLPRSAWSGGRPHGGGVRFGEDAGGQRVVVEALPVIEAPSMPAEIEDALRLLTCGEVKAGLQYLRQHPVMQGWDGFSADGATRTAERIESQWLRCYQQAQRTRHAPPRIGGTA